MADEKTNCLIIETGSYATRVGFASEECPRFSVPSVMAQCGEENLNIVLYGKEAIAKKEEAKLLPLFVNNKVNNWEDLKSFWQHITFNELEVDVSEKPTLVNYHDFNDNNYKKMCSEIFFEEFQVPYFFMISECLLNLFAVGKINGMVLTSGFESSSCTPVSEGNVFEYAHVRVPYGGKNVTSFISQIYNLDIFSANELKEQFARISLDYNNESEALSNSKIIINNKNTNLPDYPKETILPDGEKIVFKENMIKAPEFMFRTESFDKYHPSIQEVVYESLLKLDNEYRREIMGDLIISGGNTNLPGFDKRIEKELADLLPTILKFKTIATDDRQNSTFLGGSIVSKLSTFLPKWISKLDYQEYGFSLLNRKCF